MSAVSVAYGESVGSGYGGYAGSEMIVHYGVLSPARCACCGRVSPHEFCHDCTTEARHYRPLFWRAYHLWRFYPQCIDRIRLAPHLPEPCATPGTCGMGSDVND